MVDFVPEFDHVLGHFDGSLVRRGVGAFVLSTDFVFKPAAKGKFGGRPKLPRQGARCTPVTTTAV